MCVPLAAQGKYDEAKRNLERAVAIREKALGAEHPDVAIGLNNLGMLLTSKFIIDLVFFVRHAFSAQYVCLLLT